MSISVPMAFVLGAGLAGMLTIVIVRRRRAASEVIVAVTGVTITAPEFYHRLEIKAGPQVLNQLLEEELLLQFARKRKLFPSDAAVRARMLILRQQPGVADTAPRMHITERDVERESRLELAKEALFGENVIVTDADARNYYRAQTDTHNPGAIYYIPETAQLFAISAGSEQQARQAYQALRHGLAFTEAVHQYSQDETAGDGGRMPPVMRGRTRFAQDPALESAIFQLQPGELLGPRKFLGAWIVLKSDGVTSAHTVPYESVRKECMERARLNLGASANTGRVQVNYSEFRKTAPIQVFWEQYYYDLTAKPVRARR
jgi:hypothetical protein